MKNLYSIKKIIEELIIRQFLKCLTNCMSLVGNQFMRMINIIGLTKDDKSITLEPGNQIELSGAKLNNIHEACAESHEYLFELKQVIEKLNFKIISAGFDPISKLSDIPNNPKQRYEVMTKDMPEGGSLSLDMMYRTCGTQLNVDYVSEQDFTKKFKLSNYLVPINIALFANSSVIEKKIVVTFLIDLMLGNKHLVVVFQNSF